MKAIKITLIAAAVFAAVCARAEHVGLTRAEVVAELDAARASGELGAYAGEDSGSFHLSRHGVGAQKTRAEVVSELEQARSDGSLASAQGEDSGSFVPSRNAAHRADDAVAAHRDEQAGL